MLLLESRHTSKPMMVGATGGKRVPYVPATHPAPVTVLSHVDESGRLNHQASQLLASLAPGSTVRIEVLPTARRQSEPSNAAQCVLLAVVVAAVGVVAALAVQGADWQWTGFKGNETVWGWLGLLVTPVAIASVPIRLMARNYVLARWWSYLGLGLVVAFAAVVVAGYGAHWSWTGMSGARLWDWLTLLLFPVVLVFLPEWFKRGTVVSRAGALTGAVALVAFIVVIIGGYRWGWNWTGFTGNTLWNWLSLLIAPFLLPVACRWFHLHLLHRSGFTREAVG